MSYTGSKYANVAAVKTDWPTSAYMRYAILTAMQAWNAPGAEKTAENARTLSANAALHDAGLIATGTAKIVSDFYKERLAAPTVADADMLAFMNSVTDKEIDAIIKGLKNTGGGHLAALHQSANVFNDAGKTYLHAESLTDSFQAYLKSHTAQLAVLSLKPRELSPERINQLASDQNIFNMADQLDFQHPSVRQKMLQFNANREKSLISPALVFVRALDNAKTADDIQKPLAALAKLLGSSIDVTAITTTEQAQALADRMNEALMSMRMGVEADAAALQQFFEKSVTDTQPVKATQTPAPTPQPTQAPQQTTAPEQTTAPQQTTAPEPTQAPKQNVTTPPPTEAPQPTPAPTEAPKQEASSPQSTSQTGEKHLIKYGENLTKIARGDHDQIEKIKKLIGPNASTATAIQAYVLITSEINGIDNMNLIYTGKTLTLPTPEQIATAVEGMKKDGGVLAKGSIDWNHDVVGHKIGDLVPLPVDQAAALAANKPKRGGPTT